MLKKTACVLSSLLLGACIALAIPGAAPAAGKPNLNTVTLNELSAAPGVGEDLAKKIVDLRSDMGDFTGWEDLKDVEGMTDDMLKSLKDKFEILGVEGTDCNC